MTYPFLPEGGTAVPAHTHAEADVASLVADLTSRLRYRGAWVGATAFALYDVVSYRGTQWLCLTAHTSGGSFSSVNWAPLGSRARTTASAARPNANYIGSLVDSIRNQALTLNRLYLAPAFASEPVVIDSLAVNVNAALASATHRVGIYLGSTNDSQSPLSPNNFTLLTEAGIVDCSTTGVKTVALPSSVTIPAETWFFLAGVSQTAAATLVVGGAASAVGFSPIGQQTAGYGGTKSISFTVDSITGALPATTSTTTTSGVDGGVGYHRLT